MEDDRLGQALEWSPRTPDQVREAHAHITAVVNQPTGGAAERVAFALGVSAALEWAHGDGPSVVASSAPPADRDDVRRERDAAAAAMAGAGPARALWLGVLAGLDWMSADAATIIEPAWAS